MAVMTDAVYTLLSECMRDKGDDKHVFTRESGARVRDFRTTWRKLALPLVLAEWSVHKATAIEPWTKRDGAHSEGCSINTANGTLQFEIKVPVGDLELSWVQSIENPSFYTMFPSIFIAQSKTPPVPEPASLSLLGTGLVAVVCRKYGRKRSQRVL